MEAPASLKAQFDAHLERVREQEAWQGPLYAPMSYILGLGGKRIRPVLLLLTWQCLSERPAKDALNPALAVELFHNFTLMHDDIMDNAPVRRGKATVHEAWDEDTAILAGDAMFALSHAFLVRDFPERAAPLIAEFTRVSVGVCEGQMADMRMASAGGAHIPAYLEMIRKKTAMLLGGSMSLAAIAAGMDEQTVRAFYEYGEAAGVGFQLQDDYLDVFAEQGKFGKQVGGDILENKKTYLLLRAMEKAAGADRKTLDRLLNEEQDPEKKVAGVTALYERLNVRAETLDRIAAYFSKAEELGAQLKRFGGFAYIDQFLRALMKRTY